MKRMNLSDGTVTTLGALTSSTAGNYERSDNKIFMVNGTDQKFYDGTTLRDIGITAPVASQVSGVTLTQVLREPTATEAGLAAVGVNAAGGAFSLTTSSGYQLYLHYIDVANGYGRGPARAIGARTTFAAGATNRFVLTGLKDLSAVNANWKKLISRTDDGTSLSKFCASASAAITALSFNSGTRLMTVTSAGHGFSTGDVIEVAVTGWADVFTIAVTDANTYTYTDLIHRNISTAGLTGTGYKLVVVANATTAQDITVTTTGTLTANADLGLGASTIGGAQPGYLIYVSIYNPTTGEISNRIAITGRINNTDKAIYYLQGLSSLAGVNSEFSWLFGRSGDGAVVPYVIADSAVNWQYIDNDRTSFLIREAAVDGASELPTTNDKPSGFKQIKRVLGRLYGRKANSPYIFWTNDASDTAKIGKNFSGWSPANFDTFPTAEDTTCIAESDSELVVFSQNDAAIFTDVGGTLMWRGPWNIGCAGENAYVKTKYGDYWVTGDRRLAKKSDAGPIIVSAEYERALLSKIGSAYLSSVELAYIDDSSKGLDHIKISCRDSNGTPFELRHDFKLLEARSPDGQGYEAVYQGALASQYTMRQVRDSNGVMRIYAGGSDGKFYQMDQGGNDNGTDFTAEYIGLVNQGEERKSNPYLTFFGDSRIVISSGPSLNTTLAQLESDSAKLKSATVNAKDFLYRVTRPSVGVDSPEYFLITLTSHPTDAADSTNPLALNDPPHLPVENYGRIYGVKMAYADTRGQ